MTPTPTELIEAASALKPVVAAASEQIDRERDIPKHIVKQMADAGIFGMGMPAAVGGTASDLVTQMTVIEELSAGNGSVGWIAAIGIGTSAFVVGCPVESQRRIFEHGPGTPLAGAGAPQGRGQPVEGGYRVTGRWQFASGCANARWMVANFLVEQESLDAPREVRTAAMPIEDVLVIDTWQTVGLRGTGSHDFEVSGLFVPSQFAVSVRSKPLQPDPLFRLPLSVLLPLENSAQTLGMARGALDAFVELTTTKVARTTGAALADQSFAHETLARGEAKLAAARNDAYRAARWAWDRAMADQPTTLEERARYRLAMVNAAHMAGEVIDSVYYAGGGDVVYDASPLGRFFRDWHTGSQHIQVSPAHYATAGRVILGVGPMPPW